MKLCYTMLLKCVGFLIITDLANGQLASEHSGDKSYERPALLEEVIVTASKREQRLQDIPMSINAFSGERLQESGIFDVTDLQSIAAGMSVNVEGGLTKIFIRGVGNDNFTVGAEAGVAVHRDGVYLLSQLDVGLGLFDVERIEVVRGPQGTLYGRNATGGAVNIISRSPTRSFEMGGRLSIGDYDLMEVDGYLSGPLAGDRVSARAAVKSRHREGYTPNHYNGDDYDDGDFSAGRLSINVQATDSLSLDIIADYANDDSIPVFVNSRGLDGNSTPPERAGGTTGSGRSVSNNDLNINEKESRGIAMTLDWELSSMQLRSLTAYRTFDWLYAADFDGTDISFVYWSEPERRETTQVSQELTLSSTGDGFVDWLVGVYAWREEQSQTAELVFSVLLSDVAMDSAGADTGVDTSLLDPIAFYSLPFHYGVEDYTNEAYAVFGEANIPLTDRLLLTLGGRYSYEEKVIVNAGSHSEDLVVPFDDRVSDDDSWSSVTPKAALTYAFDAGVSFYATVSKGFKAGGYNGSSGNPVGAYAPEEVVNYEVGIKGMSSGGRMRGNVSAFYMDYSDMQQTVYVDAPQGTVATVANAASAEMSGVEVDVEVQPTSSLRFDATAAYLDAQYSEWNNAPDALRPDPDTGDPMEFDVSGNRLQNAPEWTTTLGATYTVSLDDLGYLSLRAEGIHKSRTFFTAFEEKFHSQESYRLFNFRLGFESVNGRFYIAGWMKNVADEEVASFKRELADFGLWSYYLPPRTYGLTLGFNL